MAGLYRSGDPYQRLNPQEETTPEDIQRNRDAAAAIDEDVRRSSLARRSESTRALVQGVENVRSSGYAARGLVRGLALGNEEGALEDFRESQRIAAQAQAEGPKVQNLKDINGVGDAAAYVRNLGLTQLPNIALAVATGGTAAVGRVAVGSLVRGAAVRGMANAAAANTAERTVAKIGVDAAIKRSGTELAGDAASAASRSAAVDALTPNLAARAARLAAQKMAPRKFGTEIAQGAAAGGVTSGTLLQSSMAPGIVLDEDPNNTSTVKERMGVAAVGALATGSLEAMPVFALFKRFGLTGATQAISGGIAKRVGTHMARQGAVEGATEVAQTVGERAAHKWVNDNVEMMSPEALNEYLNAAVGGAVGGALFGAPAGLRGSGHGPNGPAIREKLGAKVQQFADHLQAGVDTMRDPVAAKAAAMGGVNSATDAFASLRDRMKNSGLNVQRSVSSLIDDEGGIDPFAGAKPYGTTEINGTTVVGSKDAKWTPMPFAKYGDLEASKRHRDAGYSMADASAMSVIEDENVARGLHETGAIAAGWKALIGHDISEIDPKSLRQYFDALPSTDAQEHFARTWATTNEMRRKGTIVDTDKSIDEAGNTAIGVPDTGLISDGSDVTGAADTGVDATSNPGEQDFGDYEQQETTTEYDNPRGQALRDPAKFKEFFHNKPIVPGKATPKDAIVAKDAKGLRRPVSGAQMGKLITEVEQDQDFQDATTTLKGGERTVAAVIQVLTDMRLAGYTVEPETVRSIKLSKDWTLTEAAATQIRNGLAIDAKRAKLKLQAQSTKSISKRTMDVPALGGKPGVKKNERALDKDHGTSDDDVDTQYIEGVAEEATAEAMKVGPRKSVPRIISDVSVPHAELAVEKKKDADGNPVYVKTKPDPEVLSAVPGVPRRGKRDGTAGKSTLAPEPNPTEKSKARFKDAETIDSKDDVDTATAQSERDQYEPGKFEAIDRLLEGHTRRKVGGNFDQREALYERAVSKGKTVLVSEKGNPIVRTLQADGSVKVTGGKRVVQKLSPREKAELSNAMADFDDAQYEIALKSWKSFKARPLQPTPAQLEAVRKENPELSKADAIATWQVEKQEKLLKAVNLARARAARFAREHTGIRQDERGAERRQQQIDDAAVRSNYTERMAPIVRNLAQAWKSYKAARATDRVNPATPELMTSTHNALVRARKAARAFRAELRGQQDSKQTDKANAATAQARAQQARLERYYEEIAVQLGATTPEGPRVVTGLKGEETWAKKTVDTTRGERLRPDAPAARNAPTKRTGPRERAAQPTAVVNKGKARTLQYGETLPAKKRAAARARQEAFDAKMAERKAAAGKPKAAAPAAPVAAPVTYKIGDMYTLPSETVRIAGLLKFGKHTMLVHRRNGDRFVVTEPTTDRAVSLQPYKTMKEAIEKTKARLETVGEAAMDKAVAEHAKPKTGVVAQAGPVAARLGEYLGAGKAVRPVATELVAALQKTRSRQQLYVMFTKIDTLDVSESTKEKVVEAAHGRLMELLGEVSTHAKGELAHAERMTSTAARERDIRKAMRGARTAIGALKRVEPFATASQKRIIELLLKVNSLKAVPFSAKTNAMMEAGEATGVFYSDGNNPLLSNKIEMILPSDMALRRDALAADSIQALLHEAIHAATTAAEFNHPESAKAVQEMLDHARAQAKAMGIDPTKFYGLSETQEFLAEAFTNPEFQKLLKSMPPANTSMFKDMWDQFKGFIAELLGFEAADATLLDEVFAAGTFMAAFTGAQRAEAQHAIFAPFPDNDPARMGNAAATNAMATPASGSQPTDFMFMLPPNERTYMELAFSRSDIKKQIRDSLPADKKHLLDTADDGPTLLVNTGIALALRGKIDLGPKATSALRELYNVIRHILQIPTAQTYGRQIMDDIRTGRAMQKGYDVQARTLSDTALKITQVVNKHVRPAVRTFAVDVDTRMRQTGVPALTRLATLLSQRTGEFRSDGQAALTRRVFDERNRRFNALYKIIGGWDKDKMAAVQKALAENVTKPPAEIAKEVAAVRGYLKDMHTYLAKSGLKMGNVKDYYPVVLGAEKIAADPDGWYDLFRSPNFEAPIRKFYGDYVEREIATLKLNPTLTPEDMKKLRYLKKDLVEIQTGDIDELIKRMYMRATGGNFEGQLGQVTFSDGAHDPTFRAKNVRASAFVFKYGTPDQIAKFAEFQDDNLQRVLVNYTQRGVRRAEWERLNLGQDVKSLLARAAAEGATPKQLQMARDYVDQIMGSYGTDWHPMIKRVLETVDNVFDSKLAETDFRKFEFVQTVLVTYQNLRLLPLALASSLIDPLGVMIRSGSPSGAWSSYREAFKAMRAEGGANALRDLAEDLGIVERHAVSEALIYMYGGTYDPTGRTAKINAALFKYNGLEMMTKFSRLAALSQGHRFLIKHATSTDPRSTRYLTELGLVPADIKIVNGKILRTAKTDAALTRFVDESVVRPTPAQRPQWQNDPHFMLAAQYKGYLYSFWNVVVRRAILEVKDGNYAVLLPLLLYIPIQAMGEMARDGLQDDGEDKDMLDYTAQGFERSGLFGPHVNLLQAAKGDISSHNSPLNSIAGPTGQQLSDMYDSVAGNRDLGETLRDAQPLSALTEKW